MGWSSAFRAALSRNDPRRHRVRSLPGPEAMRPAPEWTITGDATSLGVALAGTGETAGAHLSVPSWESTIGAFSVDLVGDGRPLLSRIWKGQLCVHEVSFDGVAWEPVQLGVVHDLGYDDGGNWRLDCLDITAGLKTRYTTATQEMALFAIYGMTEDEAETGVNLSSTGGGILGTRTTEQYGPDAEPTVDVIAGANVFGDTGASQGRLVCIDPSAGNRFFARYTGTTATTLTGCTDNVYGTIARVKAAGAVVQTVPFIEDHPLDILRKILVSNGRSSDTPTARANGAWNTLPRTWGFGIPDYLVDHDDIDQWKPRLAPSTGSDNWVMLSEREQPDGWAYLQGWGQRAGIFLTTQQGRITARGVIDPLGSSAASGTTGLLMGRLSGALLVPGSARWSAWSGSGSEYSAVRTYTATANSEYTDTNTSAISDAVRSHPSEGEYVVALQDTIFGNESAHRHLINTRLAPWVLTLCEKLEVEVVHPLAKGLAVGDVILLDIPHLGGRDWPSAGSFKDRAAMVVGVDPDWWTDKPTRLVLATPPPSWWAE